MKVENLNKMKLNSQLLLMTITTFFLFAPSINSQSKTTNEKQNENLNIHPFSCTYHLLAHNTKIYSFSADNEFLQDFEFEPPTFSAYHLSEINETVEKEISFKKTPEYLIFISDLPPPFNSTV